MIANRMKTIAASVALGTVLFAPGVSAQCNDARASRVRPASARAVAQRSDVRYVEREPERSKTKSALMIAGGAAAGAGVGGALNGRKGALIGAAIGGGSASIYEAAKRR